VWFAGNAAHLVPIFSVRGTKSGIDDADNLAWKLAFVINSVGPERLLDSYSDERVFAAHENPGYGKKSTEFMAPPSFAFELMPTAVLSLAVRHPGMRLLINPRQTSVISYTKSPLNAMSDPLANGPAPGAVLPECPLALVERGDVRGAHMTGLVALRFTALYFCETSGIPADLRELEVHARTRGLPLPFTLVPVCRRQPIDATRLTAWDRLGRTAPDVRRAPGHAASHPPGWTRTWPLDACER